MDAQAATLLSTLKRPAATSESKVNALNALKSDIKHYRVPENAQATIFECLKVAISQQASSTLASTAFSTLGHLIKRLKIQDTAGHTIAQLSPRLLPALHDKLGDLKETIRAAASQALTELYPFCASEVETLIRDDAITNGTARAKQTGLQWVVKMHKEEDIPFKAYTQSMVARLEDADGSVRETAKTSLIELFSDAPDRAKTDLKRQMKVFAVRVSIESQILSHIGSTASSTSQPRPPTAATPEPDVDMAASTRSIPSFDHVAAFKESINSEAAQPPPPETVPMDPIYVHSRGELEQIFRDMLPHFEGKETEQNWTPRDKAVLKLRRLTTGNAPSEFHQPFMAGIKSMIEGMLKVANSLRTTMSSNGCQLVQELARNLGPAMDPHVEMLLQSFVKMSAATKHIASENGKATADAIFQHCSYNSRVMQHVWLAAQDKNAQTRQCAPAWLKTILKRQASYKSHFESSGGLELAEKCIKKGLDDANPKVKESMRAAFWTFAKHWPDKADAIMAKLDPKSKTALEKDSNNPNVSLHTSQVSVAAAPARAGAASRNALREMMAEQRKAKAAGRLPDRPSSAMAQLSPAKTRPTSTVAKPSNLSTMSRSEARVASTSSAAGTPSASSTATRKGSSLMSGPVRRPRRPEMPRPQTADPYAAKRLLRPETPNSVSSAESPPKGTANSKTMMATSSAARNRAKTAGTVQGSPIDSPVKRSPRPMSSLPLPNSRPTSKGSTQGEDLSQIREDDFTMMLPTSSSISGNRAAYASSYKRPALAQTMSVDSGVPAMAEDEGFTMVLPDLQSHQPRATSPLAYRSPLKAMFEQARDRINSMSPKADEKVGPTEDRVVTSRSGSPTKAAEEVQIYEDPFVTDSTDVPPEGERKVLGELPVNENVRAQSPTQSNGSGASPADSPRQPSGAAPQDRVEVLRNRKLLASGLDRIRAKTLDAHGFRRLQEVAKSGLDIWEGGKKPDELMLALLEYLQTFDSDAKLMAQGVQKTAALKAQALGLVRALLTLHKKCASAWAPKVLVTVLVCRRCVDGSSNSHHTIADLEKTAELAVKLNVSESCLDAVVNFLRSESEGASGEDSKAASRSTAMALTLLRQLLDSAQQQRGDRPDLGAERKVRLVKTTARYLDDADAEVRKADVELASDLFDLFGSSKAEFWGEFKGTDEGRLGLLTYYIAKRGKAVSVQ